MRGVDHVQQQVGVQRLLERALERLDQLRGQLLHETDRVRHHGASAVGQLQPTSGGVERREQLVGDQGARTGQAVQQRGLARVGVAHEREREHVVAPAVLGPERARALCLLQVVLQPGDPAIQLASVDFELGLTGSTGADARAAGHTTAGLPGQGLAPTAQARQQIGQLGKLHLRLALLGGGVLGEDIQDDDGAVEHLHLESLFEVALLGRGQLVVEDGRVGAPPGGAPQRLHLQRRLGGVGGVGGLGHVGHVRRVGRVGGRDPSVRLVHRVIACSHSSSSSPAPTSTAGPVTYKVSTSQSTCSSPPGSSTVTCRSAPARRCAATAIADEPVPEAMVSPDPRSQMRPTTRSGAGTLMNSTLVCAGNCGSRSMVGPQVSTGAAATSSTKRTAWGLPIDTVVAVSVIGSSVATPPAPERAITVSGLTSTCTSPSSTGAPMSTRTLLTAPPASRSTTSTVLTPPRVSTLTTSPCTRPWSTTCLATQRTPLPHISARLPSAFQ